MFAVPDLPTHASATTPTPEHYPVLPMLSKHEIADLEGKFRTMGHFLKHPNAKSPRYSAPLIHMLDIITHILSWRTFVYDEVCKQQINDLLKECAVLENIMIQVIVQEKDFDELIAEEMKKPEGEFLQIFLTKNTPTSL